MANSVNKNAKGKAKVDADNSRFDYTNDPYFIKKREDAVKLIKRVGFPDSFIREKK